MTTGEKIHALRKSKGMTQENLAAQIHISRQAVSRWELDEVLPDTENLIQLCNLFEISIDFLLNTEVEHEAELPLALKIKETEKKKSYGKIILFSLYLLGVLVLAFVSKSLMVVFVALSLGLTIFILYLVIALLWKLLHR